MRSPELLRQRILKHCWENAYAYEKPIELHAWRMAAMFVNRQLAYYFKYNPPAKPTRKQYLTKCE